MRSINIPKVSIRRAKYGDINSLWLMTAELMKLEDKSDFVTREIYKRSLNQALMFTHQKDCFAIIARIGAVKTGIRQGCILARQVSSINNTWEIGGLYVDVNAERNIAHSLMLALTRELIRLGATTFLMTRHGNRTTGLKKGVIRGLGFVKIRSSGDIDIYQGCAEKVYDECAIRVLRFKGLNNVKYC